MATQIIINIPVPCHEDWDKMLASNQGAYCLSCRKNVIDFSGMTEHEIYNIVSSSEQPLCGRFNTLQIGQAIRKTELRNSGFGLKAVAAGIVGFMATTKLHAAGDLENRPKTVVMQKARPDTASWPAPVVKNDSLPVINAKKLTVTAKVIDDRTKEPLRNAAVRYVGRIKELYVDEKGIFKMEIPADSMKQEAMITLSAPGYSNVSMPIKELKGKRMRIIKMHEAMLMGLMTVTVTEKKQEEVRVVHDFPEMLKQFIGK